MLMCYWCLKKELEVEYVVQYIDMQKQIISTWKIMIKTKYDISYILMQTICMDG